MEVGADTLMGLEGDADTPKGLEGDADTSMLACSWDPLCEMISDFGVGVGNDENGNDKGNFRGGGGYFQFSTQGEFSPWVICCVCGNLV